MSLAAYSPDIHDTRPVVVSSEEKRTHKGVNSDRRLIKRYAIDKNEIICGERCDYLLLTERGHAYLIELKGNHVDKACSQILATYRALQNDLVGYTAHIRIIPSRNSTHTIHGTNYKKLKSCFDYNAIQIKSIYLEEELQ